MSEIDSQFDIELAELLGEAVPVKRARASRPLIRQVRQRPAANVVALRMPNSLSVSRLPHVSDAVVASCRTGQLFAGLNQFPLLPQVQHMFFSLPDIAPAADTHIAHLCAHYLGRASKFRCSTQSALASTIGCDRHKTALLTRQLANVAVHADRALKLALEGATVALASSPMDLLCYIDFSTGDETPMPVSFESHAQSDGVGDSTTSTNLVLYKSSLVECSSSKRQKTVAKLLQSASKFAMLVRRGDGQLLSVIGSSACWVQVLDRTTSNCLVDAEVCRRLSSLQADKFRVKSRATCYDKAGSNKASNRATIAGRKPGWQPIEIDCEVHVTATCQGYALRGCGDCIAGQIHFALAINFGTGLLIFKTVLQLLVSSRVVVVRTPPPARAETFRRALMRLSLDRGPRLLEKRLVVGFLPNGDIRLRDRVQIYIPVGVPYDIDQVRDSVSKSCAECLAGALFTMYPRHRWLNADRAFDEYLLLDGLCGLALPSFQLFAAELRKPGGAARLLPHLLKQSSAPHSCFPQLMGDAFDESSHATDGAALHVADQHVEHKDVTPHEAKQLENERHRRVALTWLVGDPFGEGLLIRLCLDLYQKLQRDKLHMGSDAWELEQHLAELERLQSTSTRDMPQGRLYAIVEAARNTLETEFLRRWSLLVMNPNIWDDLLPSRFCTKRFRCTSFRTLSRAEAVIEMKLRHPHAKFPIRVFLALVSPELAHDVERTKACLRCGWTSEFLSEFASSGAGISSEDAQATLRLHARMLWIHIGRIEALHASLRRRLFTRGVQTHGEQLRDASAEFVLDRIRNQKITTLLEAHKPKPVASESITAGESTTSELDDRVGGPWKFFVRREALGRPMTPTLMGELSDKYWSLSQAERDTLIQSGVSGRVARHAGSNETFGYTSRQMTRMKNSSHSTGRVLQSVSSGTSTNSVAKIDSAISIALSSSSNTSINAVMADAKKQVRAIKIDDKRRSTIANAKLCDWIATNRESSLVGLVNTSHGRVSLHSHLHPCPLRGELALELETNPSQVSNLACSILHAKFNKMKMIGAFNDDWDSKHLPIMDNGRSTAQTKRRSGKPLCSSVGVCLCSDSGHLTYCMRNGFICEMKRAFIRGTVLRDMLVDSFVVAELHGVRAAVEYDEWDVALSELVGSELVPCTAKDVKVYWHMAFTSFAPYMPTVRVMELAPEQTSESIAELDILVNIYMRSNKYDGLLMEALTKHIRCVFKHLVVWYIEGSVVLRVLHSPYNKYVCHIMVFV
jgi:hypothetical protein